MKKVLFLLGMFTLFATVTFAQERPKAKTRTAKTSGWINDTQLWVKKPIDKNVTIKDPSETGRKAKEDKLGNFEMQDKSSKVVSPRGQATGKRRKPVRRPGGGR
ncbi:hypothetical protein [Haliscomenobacter sp.]|uniref:hypothetical protein n=1 Tax=Haliscomenobacter sp. TaxID=2717303 RepID=UPI003593E8AF